MTHPKDKEFVEIIRDVANCRACARMCNSARVFGYSSGSYTAKVMFIGEAPGRLGADQTAIPFHGDAAGANFEEFLEFSGIHRSEIFVTNAVLCNPKDDKGNNATPTPSEIAACSGLLRRQIDLVQPDVVVTLGAIALRALELIEKHGLSLAQHVRSAHQWYGRELVPLYHPGQRALIHRSRANQRSDYQFLSERIRRRGQKPRRQYGLTPSDLMKACRYFLMRRGELTYFELHKFVYLLEYLHVKNTGRRLSSAHFLRQKDGPYCIELQIDKLRKADPGIRLHKRGEKLWVTHAQLSQLFDSSEELDPDLSRLVDEVLSRYSYKNEADLKRAVYLTAPMRLILRREKNERVNLYNSAIEFLAV